LAGKRGVELRVTNARRQSMAVAVIQEFPIEGDDRTTANYDRVQETLDTRANPPAGGLVHTAGFDEEAGVFRVFDVWESREAWDAFLNDRLMPIVRPMMQEGARPPETRVYDLHDFMG
jgi:quinol monooxygenase YgiN